MTFLAPLGLGFLIAVPVVLLLWLLHARFRSERVPSLLLWQNVPAPLVATRAWRLPRVELLLLLQLVAAALLAFALSRPASDSPGGRHVALVLDESASMQAQDVAPSRFDAARQQLIDVIASAGPADRFTLVLASAAPLIAIRDDSPEAVRSALDSAHAEDGAADLTTALLLAAAPGTSHVVVASDGATLVDLPSQSVPVDFRMVGGKADQLALSDVSLRQPIDGSQRLAGFASIVNYGSAQTSTTVQVVADSVQVDSLPVTLEPNSRTEVTFTVPTDTRGLRVVLSANDAVPTDKRVDLAGPQRFARTVLVVSDQPAVWEHVLASAPLLTTRSVSPADYRPPPSGDLVLFDGWLPPDLPDTERILANPPDRAGVVSREATDPRSVAIRDLDLADPLLRGLDLSGLSVTENVRAATPDWASLTAGSSDDFAIGHGVLDGRRTVLIAFDPAASNLAELVAFPLLVGNIIDWLVPGRGSISHAGLGPAADVTPHTVASIPAALDGVHVPDWFELWPFLVTIGLVVGVAEWALAVRRRLSARRPTLVSAAAGLATAAALLQPGVWLPDRAMTVVLAVDRSASISPQSQAALTTWLSDARRLKPDTDRIGVVTFGASALVTQIPSTEPGGIGPAQPGSAATDLAQALRAAAALARGHGPSRVVLLSDGHQTTGDLDSAVAGLGGIPVDVVPLTSPPATPAVVLESLDIPPYVRAGDSVDAALAVGATEQTSVGLQVQLDGRPVKDQQVSLLAGHNQLSISLSVDAVGFHRLAFSAAGKTIEGFVTVKPAERVLIVEERPGESAPMLAALRGVPGTFDVRPPGAIANLAQLEPYDAVVLDDISATSFTLDQQQTLLSYVRDRGRGMLALGGQTSFVLGNYDGSVLEQALPVQSTIPPRREDARMALLLVIDISQSMDRTVDRVTSISMAKQAAILSEQSLREDDQIGVLIFNHRFSWLQPIGRLSDIGRPALETEIASLTPSGGTEIFAALDEGATAMRAVTADLRHIVLFTDGNSRDANYDALTTQLNNDRIGLSTVGLGPEADTKLLAKLAKDGKGRFYYSDRSSELPRILATEVAIAKRSSVVEGSIQPQLAAPSPILRGIAPGELPALGGYIATTARPIAQVILQTDDHKPLLAQWRLGLGRSVAWTSDVGGAWTQKWADWANDTRLWQQAVAWAAGVPVQPDFQLSITSSGSTARITLDDLTADDQFVNLASPVATITAPGGAQSSVALRQSAPGRYAGSLIADRPGTYAVTVSESQRTETGGFVVAAQPEQAAFGADEHTLRRIASDTGGRMLNDPADAFRDDGRQGSLRWQPLWPVCVGLGLVLFIVGLALRRLSFTRFGAPFAERARPRSAPLRVRR